jgi:hypothetical protein
MNIMKRVVVNYIKKKIEENKEEIKEIKLN